MTYIGDGALETNVNRASMLNTLRRRPQSVIGKCLLVFIPTTEFVYSLITPTIRCLHVTKISIFGQSFYIECA